MRAIYGYEVARRARAIADPRHRAALYFLQARAIAPGGLEALAGEFAAWGAEGGSILPEDLRAAAPGTVFGEEERRELGRELGFDATDHGTLADLVDACDDDPPRYRAELDRVLREGSLPPERTREEFVEAFRERAGERALEAFAGLLSGDDGGRPWRREEENWDPEYGPHRFVDTYPDRLGGGAVTETGAQVYEALEYARTCRGFTLIEGPSRTGKTHAAKAWVAANHGRARYAQMESAAKLRETLQILNEGVGNGYSGDTAKDCAALKQRLRELFGGGDLLLVIDEAHWLWGTSPDSAPAFPLVVTWLMSGLVERGTPVVLIATEQMRDSHRRCAKASGWRDEQFRGRVENWVKLPDRVGREDLKAVARSLLPAAGEAEVGLLADAGAAGEGHLQALQKAVHRAVYTARKAGRKEPCKDDIRAAIAETLNMDAAFSKAMPAAPAAPGKTGRKTAPARRAAGGGAASAPAPAPSRLSGTPLIPEAVGG